MPSWRLIGAAVCCLCAVGMDFNSMLLSVVSDLFFVVAAWVLIWPALSKLSKS